MTRHLAHGRRRAPLAALLALAALLLGSAIAAAAPAATRTLVPIGSGYEPDTLARFALAAAQHDTSGTVDIVVLPTTFGTDPNVTSPSERKKNLTLADSRRGLVEDACIAVKAAAQTCHVTLAPVLVRDDAYVPSTLDLFVADLDGMYILGGDQTIAMLVTADTPLEQRMAAAYAAGAAVGGNSAGAAVESLHMIAGYTGSNGPENGLQAGSVDIWYAAGVADRERGLIFGLSNALLDQHVLQRGRIARLINASWTSGLLGVGADAETAATIVNEATLTDVTGRSAAFVADTSTYGSAGRFAGPTSSLAISRVATHVIPQDGGGYDLLARRPLLNGQPLPPPSIAGRSFGALKSRHGAGPLLLGGDISGDKAGLAAGRFLARSGGSAARVLVLTTGYAKSTDAKADAKAYADAFRIGFGATVEWFALDIKTDQAAIRAAIDRATGVFLTAPDQSRVGGSLAGAQALVDRLRARWQAGMPLMADNAAAAALGQSMTANPPPPQDTAGLEEAGVVDFRPDHVIVQAGQGWVAGAGFEPRMLPDRHWGRLYNLLASDRRLLGVGVDVGTALEITPTGATVWGSSAAVVLDGRLATFNVGANGALGARYVVLDTFVHGDSVAP